MKDLLEKIRSLLTREPTNNASEWLLVAIGAFICLLSVILMIFTGSLEYPETYTVYGVVCASLSFVAAGLADSLPVHRHRAVVALRVVGLTLLVMAVVGLGLFVASLVLL